MIVAMRSGATEAELQQVLAAIEGHGLSPVSLPGGDRVAVGIASAIPADLRGPLTELLEAMPGVDHVAQVSRAYKLASREFHPVDSVVEIKGVTIGAPTFTVAAGPCAIESRDQLMRAAEAVKKAGADGLLIEAHPDPAHALCDGPQSISLDVMQNIMDTLPALCRGKRI